MRATDFDYDLPESQIARRPAARRDGARLLVRGGDGAEEARRHLEVSALAELLRPGDLVVVNDTRVLRARFRGRRETGGKVELLFLEPATAPGVPEGTWLTLAKPAKKLRAGEPIRGREDIVATPVERDEATGGWYVRLSRAGGGAEEPVESLLEAGGEIPLPPYLERDADDDDTDRYQTVYAEHPGAVAAPTAGLHLTEALLAELEERGVERAAVTLHVGAGTFRPVTVDRIEDHPMHVERFVLPEVTADAVRECRRRGGRVVAIGTTAARVLESRAVDVDGGRAVVEAGSGTTDLFLRPGHGPRVIDGLLTNFHLPRSTLLMLVASFIGREETLSIYADAVERGYRFYSYGDAMLLWRDGAESVVPLQQ